MKICILATGRCGSTSLYSCIKEHLNDEYTFLEEPFDRYETTKKGLTIDFNTPNVLIKTLIGQVPNIEDGLSFYQFIYETFDKVIILDRKNKLEQTESFVFHTTNNVKDRHNRKRIYYLNSIPKHIMDKWNRNLNEASELLKILSKEYSSKIYYYEDIFVNKNEQAINEIFNYLDLTPIKELVDSWIISDNKKVRITEKYDKLL
jgi:hypothetical protein